MRNRSHQDKILKVIELAKKIDDSDFPKWRLFLLGSRRNTPLLWESIVSNLEKRNITLSDKEINRLSKRNMFDSTRTRLQNSLKNY